MYIAAGQGQTTPGDKILMSAETACHFGHLLQVSKTISLKSDFIHFFMILYMYIAPGLGAVSPQGTEFWCQQKGLITLPICCKFQRNLCDFIQFFHDLIHVYSPGAGGIQPPGVKDLMSTKASCHFGHLLLVLNHRRQQFPKNPLFYLFPIQKCKGPNLTLP